MSELIPCIEYDSKTNTCKSGFVRIHPVCRGVLHHTKECSNCGHAKDIPMCMMEDQSKHLIREDGMPLGWPYK